MVDVEKELAQLKEEEKKKQQEIAETKKKIEQLNKQLDAQNDYEKKILLEQIMLKEKQQPLEEKVIQEQRQEHHEIDQLYEQIVNIYQSAEGKGYVNKYEQEKIDSINNFVDQQAKNYSFSEEVAQRASAIKSIGKHLSYQNIYK